MRSTRRCWSSLGFPDHESAVAAIKLGAVDYKSKPLTGDDLIAAIRALISGLPSKTTHELDRPPSRPGAALDTVARRLTEPVIGALEFVLLARSFRHLVGGSDHRHQPERTQPSCTPIDTALATKVLEHIARTLTNGISPSLQDVAHAMAVPAEDVTPILKELTDSDFRECRRILRVRPAIAAVAWSDEQIAQIAYRHGYEWPGQLDRDFKTTLRLAPHTFRRLFRTLSIAEDAVNHGQ
jgi:YesN/AraC family two-component response regulator